MMNLDYLKYECVEPKYELTEETKEVDGKLLYRIRAVKDFADVKTGDLGGFVESKDNLSELGNCWIYNNACVYDNSRIYGNAKITHNAIIKCWVKIYDNAEISDNAIIEDYSEISGNMKIFEFTHINSCLLSGHMAVYGKTDMKNIKLCGVANLISCECCERYSYDE